MAGVVAEGAIEGAEVLTPLAENVGEVVGDTAGKVATKVSETAAPIIENASAKMSQTAANLSEKIAARTGKTAAEASEKVAAKATEAVAANPNVTAVTDAAQQIALIQSLSSKDEDKDSVETKDEAAKDTGRPAVTVYVNTPADRGSPDQNKPNDGNVTTGGGTSTAGKYLFAFLAVLVIVIIVALVWLAMRSSSERYPEALQWFAAGMASGIAAVGSFHLARAVL